MSRKSEEKWIDGIREILQQLFILIAVGSLFIFLPLHAKTSVAREAADAQRPMQMVTVPNGTQWQSLGSWLVPFQPVTRPQPTKAN